MQPRAGAHLCVLPRIPYRHFHIAPWPGGPPPGMPPPGMPPPGMPPPGAPPGMRPPGSECTCHAHACTHAHTPTRPHAHTRLHMPSARGHMPPMSALHLTQRQRECCATPLPRCPLPALPRSAVLSHLSLRPCRAPTCTPWQCRRAFPPWGCRRECPRPDQACRRPVSQAWHLQACPLQACPLRGPACRLPEPRQACLLRACRRPGPRRACPHRACRRLGRPSEGLVACGAALSTGGRAGSVGEEVGRLSPQRRFPRLWLRRGLVSRSAFPSTLLVAMWPDRSSPGGVWPVRRPAQDS